MGFTIKTLTAKLREVSMSREEVWNKQLEENINQGT